MSEKSISPGRIALARLKHHRPAMVAAGVLAVLYFCAIFADFLAPYSYKNEDRKRSSHPPTIPHFFDEKGRFHLRPFVYGTRRIYGKVYEVDRSVKYPIRFFVRGDRHRILGLFETQIRFFGVDEPGRIYLLGADDRGRDLFSRLLYGSRVSLSVGIVGVVVSFLIGMLVGGISGYFSGKVDNALMRLCEMVMMIPGFYLMLALRAVFPAEMSSVAVYIMIILILSFIGWAGLARVIRGMVISIREQEFVASARSLGASHLTIIWRHILPNTFSYAIVAMTISIPGYILGESALSFIGVGIQDPQTSWGLLLSDAMSVSQIKYHPWVLIPGVLIFITVMAFNFFGDGLRDAFDPRLELRTKIPKEYEK